MGYVYIIENREPEKPKGGGCVQAFVIAFIISIVLGVIVNAMNGVK
jgi:hypothetical protein